MPRRISQLAMALAAALSLLSASHAQDFKKQVIYQLITDRFFDGTPSDNNPPQSLVFMTARKPTGTSPGAATSPAGSHQYFR